MGPQERVQFEIATQGDDHRISIRTGADDIGKALDLQSLSDNDLTQNLKLLVAARRRCTAAILDHLIEFERRDLPLRKSYPSLFAYCVKELGFSEDVACRHIVAARAIKKFPSVMGLIGRGELELTTLCILNRHLTASNHRSLLGWAVGKSKREVERMIAEIAGPSALPARDVIRMKIQPRQASATEPEAAAPLLNCAPATAISQGEPPTLAISRREPPTLNKISGSSHPRGDGGSPPLPPGLEESPSPLLATAAAEEGRHQEGRSLTVYRLSMTCSQDVFQMLERAKALLKHKHPSGRLESIMRELLNFYLNRKDPFMKKSPAKPRPAGERRRRIPQWVRDAVYKRDGGRCAFFSPAGGRCEETAGLELDHITPWARGGRSDEPANIRLLCRSHNAFEARRIFGDAVPTKKC